MASSQVNVRETASCESGSKKPENIHEYLKWYEEKLSIIFEPYYQTYYELVSSKAKTDFKASKFWVQLLENLSSWDQEYQINTSYPLFVPKTEPELLSKPFDSFLLKTFRKNVLENENWPKEPVDGWLKPDNWFSRLNDIIRTLFVVKYFDGVNFVVGKISSMCKENNMECTVSYEAREEGYYAAHLYTRSLIEIPRIEWDTVKIGFSIEIQISTQLQEVIRKLLHKYYEEKRKRIKEPSMKWQWDYRCDEFSANYLGHILHYVEGMIMEIREKQKEKA